MCETCEWINAHLHVLRPVATKETIVHNSCETYEQEGRWIKPEQLFEKEREMCHVVDSLLEQFSIFFNTTQKLKPVVGTSGMGKENFYTVKLILSLQYL